MSAIEAAIGAAGFKAFARALRASPYAKELESGGPYTVFAPTDAAFAKLKDAELQRVMIEYHFAAGKVMSSRFAGKRIKAMTHGGDSVMIDGKAGLRVNGANLVEPDIIAGDCVIHGIDGVLWPQESAVGAK